MPWNDSNNTAFNQSLVASGLPARNNWRVRWQSHHSGLTWHSYNCRHTPGWKPPESRQRSRRPVSDSSANLPSARANTVKPTSHLVKRDTTGPNQSSGPSGHWSPPRAASACPCGLTATPQPPHPRALPHGQFGKPVCWRNSGAGNNGTSSTGGPNRKCNCSTQTLEVMIIGSQVRCHTGRLSGFEPASPKRRAVFTQIRTGKVRLAAFLCKCQVPGFPMPACSCGAQWETAKHVILDCPRLQRVRRSLYTAAATTDYQVMISRPRPAAALTSWILRHGVLPQFSWAQEQLETGY